MAKKVKTRRKLVLLFSAIIGLIAVILAIVGIVTRNWISVQGNTNELQNNFGQLLDANGTFVVTAAAVLTALGIPEPLTKLIVIGLANATLTQVEGQLSNNLQSTTYSLFDKKVSVARTEVPELKLSQGLVIAGLVCLFSGTLLATLILCIPVNLRYIGLIAIVSLFFLALGSILILLGYLLFTRAITEDFGHELGIKVTLGYSFILVTISSIIGFLTAISFALSLIPYVHQARNMMIATKTSDTIGHAVSLRDQRRIPVPAKVEVPVVSIESF
ncbi:unnamed protein product [Rotaria sordida]|uniref:Uncharacterized protein n=1 Tax=Rotaria sordida TaxID=392033 RepID=A0A813YKN3_9BILA|nr:unnamed protein product [Rotaria sordida]CAF3763401.1 unnamed protein product [Rotaria sordida]